MAKPDNEYDRQHLLNLGLSARKITTIFDAAANEAAAIGASIRDFNPKKPFSFADYPNTKASIEKAVKSLKNRIETAIVNGARAEWTLASNKNNALCDLVFGDNKGKLTKEQERKYYSNNSKALEAFLRRKEAGLSLSDRVWKYADKFKEEIEMGLDLGLRGGISAADMARDLKQYLQQPSKLFRRVRDEHGRLHLSSEAKKYHPGAGVYRSSYKNALRLARTENNMAYHASDYERWQQLDFVVGIEVLLSNNHTINGAPFTDICDDLKGKYPKAFKFTGWHPQCRCHAVTILKTPQELMRENEAILEGEAPDTGSVNEVKDVPDGFKEWISKNGDRIAKSEKAGTLPYFIKDNYRDGRVDSGFAWAPEKRVKTDAEKAAIQKRWDERKRSNALVLGGANDTLKGAKDFPEIDSSTLAELIKSKQIAKIQAESERIGKVVAEAKAEEQRLSELIPNVKKWKAEFGVEKVRAVYSAVEKKLQSFEILPLNDQLKKLKYEISWVSDSKKYSTWEVARDAYKKQLAKVEYTIAKENVKSGVAHSLGYATSTKSAKVKLLASELSDLLNKEAPIAALQAKAQALNTEVARLEAQKTKRDAIKLAILIASMIANIDESKYTQKRKDAAFWEKYDSSKADREFRGNTEKIWGNASDMEKLSVTRYTSGSGAFNRPLRGFENDWYTYKGVGKVDLDYEGAKKNIEAMTELINKSVSTRDTWVLRGIETKQGTSNFLGLGIDPSKLNSMTDNELQLLVGKIVRDEAFVSCGSMKGKGFSGDILNIYCPAGTKMIYAEPFSVYNGDSLTINNLWDGKTKYPLRNELETIIQRGAYFRITKIERAAYGKLYIDIEVVGQ